jgi:hypothetical protein
MFTKDMDAPGGTWKGGLLLCNKPRLFQLFNAGFIFTPEASYVLAAISFHLSIETSLDAPQVSRSTSLYPHDPPSRTKTGWRTQGSLGHRDSHALKKRGASGQTYLPSS